MPFSSSSSSSSFKPASQSLLLKCFNLAVLFLAFLFPVYNSAVFSLPPQHQHHLQTAMSRPHPQTIFILDFDGTITTNDTISALFSSAVDFHARNGKGEEMKRRLGVILNEYGKDLEAHRHRDSRGGGGGGFESVEELVGYQRGLKEVERRSFDRVSQSGILGGIGDQGWRGLGAEAASSGEVVVREGFREFVRKVVEKGEVGRWGIVSVNFCEAWIRGILDLGSLDESGIEVLANQPDEQGVLHGWDGSAEALVTSEGKRDAMRVLVERLREGDEEVNVVYLGDSATDVECWLEEGVTGIVMTKEDGASGLLDMLRGKYKLGGIGEYEKGKASNEVYFAKDFNEILSSPLVKKINV